MGDFHQPRINFFCEGLVKMANDERHATGGAKWTTFTNPGRSGTVGGAINFFKSGHRAAALRRRGRRRRLSTEIV